MGKYEVETLRDKSNGELGEHKSYKGKERNPKGVVCLNHEIERDLTLHATKIYCFFNPK